MTLTVQKTTPPGIMRCRGNVYTDLIPSNDMGIHRQIHRDTRNNSSIVACVFVAAGTSLPSRCLATKGGIHIRTHRPMGGIYEVRH
jgi:hypothetical protein